MHFIALQHGGEDGWCELTLPHKSRRSVGRALYRGKGRHPNRQHWFDEPYEKRLSRAQEKALYDSHKPGDLWVVGAIHIAEVPDSVARRELREHKMVEAMYHAEERAYRANRKRPEVATNPAEDFADAVERTAARQAAQ